MTTTTTLNLPLLTVQQSGKEAAINEAFQAIDAAVGQLPAALEQVKADVIDAVNAKAVDLSPVTTAVESISAALELTKTSILAAVGAIDFTPVQSSISDTRVDIAAVKAVLEGLNLTMATGAGAYPGEVRQFNTTTGLPPAGWSLASGIVPNLTPYSSIRWVALPWSWQHPVKAWAGTKLVGTVHGNSALSIYDIATGAATTPTAFPLTNYTPSNLISTEDELYSFGSFINTATIAATNYRYRYSGTTWEALASTPTAHANFIQKMVAKTADGKFLFVGGTNNTSATATSLTNLVTLYNPNSNTWETKANAPIRMYGGRVVRLLNGEILFFPYATSDGTTLVYGRRVFIYTPSTDTWREIDSCPIAASLVFLKPDGKVVNANTAAGYALDLNAAAGSQWLPHGVQFTFQSGTVTGLQNFADSVFCNPMNNGFIGATLQGSGAQTQMLFQTQFDPGTSVSSVIGVKN